MIFETYICALSDGRVEYGFTFKASADTEDTLFDAMLGAEKPSSTTNLEQTTAAAWLANTPYAQAMCAETLTSEQRAAIEERQHDLEMSLNGDATDDHDRGVILDEIAAIEARLDV